MPPSVAKEISYKCLSFFKKRLIALGCLPPKRDIFSRTQENQSECSRLRGENRQPGHLGPKDTDGVGVDLAEALHFLSHGRSTYRLHLNLRLSNLSLSRKRPVWTSQLTLKTSPQHFRPEWVALVKWAINPAFCSRGCHPGLPVSAGCVVCVCG